MFMQMKDIGENKTKCKIFNVPLSNEDRTQLETLASNWNLSLAGTLRRCIQTAHDNNTKNALLSISIPTKNSSSIDNQLHTLDAMLAIHTELAAIRNVLDYIYNLLQSNMHDTTNDIASIQGPVQNNALLLSALISASTNKDSIAIEVQRLRIAAQKTNIEQQVT
jgi:hypothetical protein